MVKITAVHTRVVRARGRGNDRTASFLQQFNLKCLKSNTDMKLELNFHRLLQSFLSCSVFSTLCSAGEQSQHELALGVPHAHGAAVCSFKMSTDMLLNSRVISLSGLA